MICIYSVTLDKLLVLGKSKIQIEIVSEKYEKINSLILHEFDRGTTLIGIKGGFTGRESCAILTVVNRREFFRINEAIKNIDPNAFIMIGQVKEVCGRGFTKKKKYETR